MDAICFDMDGVVVDSERHWVPLENERILPAAVESSGSDGPTASEITGMNVRDLHAYLEREYGTTVTVDELVATYDDAAVELYEERVSLLDGFDDVLATLEAAGVAVALVSSSPHRWIDRVLDRFELRDAFGAIHSGEDVAEGKPAPAIYERAVADLGVDAADAVAVEDSAHGVAAASAAGLHVVGYRTAANADADLDRADEVVAGPDALRETLTERAGER